jgi:hypothetical protein
VQALQAVCYSKKTMLVYLDTKDLIDVLEGETPCTDELTKLLVLGDHELTISFATITELAAPLVRRHAKTNVMRLLNKLERLPLRFIHEARIEKLELQEAVDAFSRSRKYSPVDPFVARFDQTIDLHGSLQTKRFLRYPLAETVFDIWQANPEVLQSRDRHLAMLRQALQSDRMRNDPPDLAEHFRTTVRRDLDLYGVLFPSEATARLADWIYERAHRCPALRLGYELYHHLRRNRSDPSQAGDLGDFAHVHCLPYVDLMTLDRRMRGYVSQALKTLGVDYCTKVVNGLPEVHEALTGRRGRA